MHFTRIMTNIVAVSHDSAACYLMIWRHLLTLISTLKKEAAFSSETLVMRYQSKHCHFPIHSNLPEHSYFHGTWISWIILITSSSSTLSSTKNVTLIQLTHTNPSFLNSISLLSSSLHLHLFIMKILNPTFVRISHFVYMCTCPTFLIIFDLTISGLLSDTDKTVEITFHFNTVADTNTSTKKTIISLYWHYSFLFSD